MASETDRRVPSLVSCCQRVLSAHAEAIACLGDDIRYDVIKPVLECCSADSLLRLEQSSPYLEQDTSDLWERLCFKSYPLLAEQLVQNVESWRDQYFLLREAEAHRLEEVASRLRNQRIEAAERKREREVKLTDRLPPSKRTRGASSQPKTLFQKTMSEATKFRRSLYMPRLRPSAPPAKVHPTTANSTAAASTETINSRSCVETVSAGPSSASIPKLTPRSVRSTGLPDPVFHKTLPSIPRSLSPVVPQPHIAERPSKPSNQKRDPMASLFMPKHRALSQLPSQPGDNNRTVPAR